jgi:streptomycin 3"-adenylyltransferase
METMRLVSRVLGTDAVLGGYLHGSAVLGGLRPHSDVDVFVVLRRRTSRKERRSLVEGLMEISGEKARPSPARPIELTVVVHDDVRPWRYPPRREFQYGEWLREAYEQGETPAPEPDPDLAPVVTMVLLGDTALVGPPPGQVLDSVPREDLFRALAAGVPELLAELEPDARNVVLTLARIWATLATGTILPKDAAADWVLARLPVEHQPVLSRARAVYLGEEAERWDDLLARLRPYADHVTGVIGRLAPAFSAGGPSRRTC